MKINAEILRRYASGECAEEERLLVENWTPDDSDIDGEVNLKLIPDLKSSIWGAIAVDYPAITQSPTKWFQLPIFRYGVAACLVVGLGVALLFSGNSVNSLHAEESNREIHRWVKSSGTISFTEVDVEKIADQSLTTILTECLGVDCTPRLIELDPEETYFAIRFQEGSEEAAIFSSEELSRFTPALWRRIVTISQLP